MGDSSCPRGDDSGGKNLLVVCCDVQFLINFLLTLDVNPKYVPTYLTECATAHHLGLPTQSYGLQGRYLPAQETKTIPTGTQVGSSLRTNLFLHWYELPYD